MPHRKTLLSPSLLLLLGLIALILATRAPFISNLLLGEEQLFAALVSSERPVSETAPRGYPEAIVGRVDGREAYTPFQHNIVPYLFFDYGLRTIHQKISRKIASIAADETVAIRLTYLIPYMIGIALLGVGMMTTAGFGSRLTIVLAASFAAFVLTTPLMVGVSIQPQVDGAFGTLLLAIPTVVLFATDRPDLSERSALAGRLSAGFLVGIGRPEWVIAFAGSTLVMCILWFLASPKENRSLVRPLQSLAAVWTGLATGVAVAFWASPQDYLDGFGVIDRVAAATGGNVSSFATMTDLLLPIVIVAVIGAVIFMINVRWLADRGFGAGIIYGAGCAIVFGYFVSGWAGDGFPRHFVPGFLLMSAFLIYMFLQSRVPVHVPLLALLTLCLSAGIFFNYRSLAESYNRGLSITSYRGMPLQFVQQRMQTLANRYRGTETIIFDTTPLLFYYPEMNYISADLGYEGAQEYIRTLPGAPVSRLLNPVP